MSCTPPTLDPATTGGVLLSSSPLENAQPLLNDVSNVGGDPTFDEYEENIANGNSTSGKRGIQVPNTPEGEPPKQTTLPPPPSEKYSTENNKAPPGGNGSPVAGGNWSGSYDEKLSPNFTVRDMTTGAHWGWKLEPYMGFDVNVRFSAMKNLVVNVLEPLRAKYGPFRINSGLRNKTTSKGVSQHIKGEAADIQFPDWNYARYWEEAPWVRDNIKYDQFLFEHSDKGSVWLHLSYSANGNRAAGARDKVMTMYRNCYIPGLKRYG
jgi:Peptidase M15